MSQPEVPPSPGREPALAPDVPPALVADAPPAPAPPGAARRLPWLALLGITVVGGFLLGMLLGAITSPLRAASSSGTAVSAPPVPPGMPPPGGDFMLMPPPGAPPPGLPPPGPPPGP